MAQVAARASAAVTQRRIPRASLLITSAPAPMFACSMTRADRAADGAVRLPRTPEGLAVRGHALIQGNA